MPIFVRLIVLACVFYTGAVFLERHIGHLQRWMLGFFLAGFLADLAGTSMMAQRATGELTLHGSLGFLALMIMFIHLVWAFKSIQGGRRAQEFFHAYSVKAWLIWMIAFVSGAWLM